MSNRRKNVFYGTIIGYVSIVLNIVSGLFFTPWIIIHFGNSGYGIYTLSTSLITMFLIDFGLSNATTTFISKYRAAGDNDGISKLLALIYRIYLVLDACLLCVFISLYFLAPFIYKGLTIQELELFRNSIIIISLFSLITFPATTFNGVINSHEKFIFLKTMDVVQRILFVIFTSISILLNLNLYFLVLSNCVSGFVTVLFKYIFIRKKLKLKADFKIRVESSDLKSFLSFTSWAALIAICSRIAFNLVPNILGIMSDSSSITFFSICSTIEGFVFSICAVSGSFFLPKIAELKRNDATFKESLSDLVTKIGKIQFLIISLIFVGFLVVGKDFIIIWMKGNTSYLPVYYGVIILITYQLFDAPQMALRSAMYIVDGGVKRYAIIESITAVLNVLLCVLFIFIANKMHTNTSIAACFSILLARTIDFVLKSISYSKIFSINMFKFWKQAYWKTIALSFLIAVFGLRLNDFLVNLTNISRFLIVGSFVTIVYVTMSIFFVLTNSEKKYYLSIRR